MYKTHGFTLIELVIVILILGILSATAVPKFLNLSSDARISSLKGIKGAVDSTSQLVYLKAKVENVVDGSIEIGGNSIEVTNGYISSFWDGAWRYALNIGQVIGFTEANATCTKNDICGLGNQGSAPGLPSTLDVSSNSTGLVLLWLKGDKLSDLCFVFYFTPGDSAPTTGIVDDGC